MNEQNAHSRDLARISSILLASLIALMTFLLIVGVQSRVEGFTTELYIAIVLLGLSLILFALGHIVAGINAGTPHKVIRGLQQLVFIGSIVSVVWFVISYAQLVVKPPTAQPQGAGTEQSQPQSPPSAQQGGASGAGAPAPGESAEQHAKEAQQPGQAAPAPAQPQPGQ